MTDDMKNQNEGGQPFLDSFLQGGGKDDAQPAKKPPARTQLETDAIEMLRSIFDPEIPVNIYDLGLIYNVAEDDGHITITMTLTSPHCPVAEIMPGEIDMRVSSMPGVREVTVDLVWEPPWTPERMSEAAKLELGFM